MKTKQPQTGLLVVDDSPDTLEVLQRALKACGYLVLTATGVAAAVELLEQAEHFDLVITDLKMPKVSGLDLVRHVRSNHPDTAVMMITGHATIESAVEAVKMGAEEYLTKPFTNAELLDSVGRVLSKLRDRRAAHASPALRDVPHHGIVGQSPAIKEVFNAVQKVASSAATVLISGESGVGKELVARAIHYSGPRAAAPFVAVNCGAIPEQLVESELFGHVKGAFTGAVEPRVGFFQTAHGGAIFLDEISELSAATQVKLLRVLQDRKVLVVGSSQPREVDVQIMAATNKDLATLVQQGQFRDDLFFRVSVINIEVPPLRERGDDILLLTNHLATKLARAAGKQPLSFSNDALEALKGYGWPGNVRELENFVQRLVVMGNGQTIEVADLPAAMRFRLNPGQRLRRTLAEVERSYIEDVLASVSGNKTKAAELLDIDRKTLREKLKSPTA